MEDQSLNHEPNSDHCSSDSGIETLRRGVKRIAVDDSSHEENCVICHELLHRPVTTECQHTACESCMRAWTLTLMNHEAIDSLSETRLSIEGIRFTCPICRQAYTTASRNLELESNLRRKHPEGYTLRDARDGEIISINDGDDLCAFDLTLLFGNSHRRIEPSPSPWTGLMRHHQFTFFVKAAPEEIIDRVQIVLHPTFRRDRVQTLTRGPFAITHRAWGLFNVLALVQLKPGWQWVDESYALNSCEDASEDVLPIDWTLDFHDNGSVQTRVVKVQRVKSTA